MSPEWMMAIDAQARRRMRTKTDVFADPLERPEWRNLDRICGFLSWCVASSATCAHGYTSRPTRSISPGLCDTMPARKTG